MYYFLDVDGVLNKESDWRNHFVLNGECVDNFNKLISKDKNPHVILTSTWRQGLTNNGTKASNEDGLIRRFKALGIEIEGTTPITNKTREEEIKYYIRRNNILNYIVLDDDKSLFSQLSELNIYFTDYRFGLTKQDVKNILKRHRYKMM